MSPGLVAEAEGDLTAWQRHLLALGAVTVGLLMLFRRDVGDIVGIWWSTSTYAHCLLIPPIIAWLVWQRVPELSALTPRGWLPGLAVVAGGALCWMLGNLAGAAIGRHLGLVVILQGSVITLLGPAVTRGLLFPIGYALFLVPAGDALVPPLQTITANMCMALLTLFAVPAHIEGVFIWVSNGYFEVAEACSGAKFLVAMLAYGVLVANVCFRSWPRRIAFVGLSVLVPILANGLRAFATIYVASLTTADAAAGFDHVVYGWIFFGVVIAIVMAIGWRFFDRRVGDPWLDPAIPDPRADAGSLGSAVTGVALIPLLMFGWSMASIAIAPHMSASLPSLPGWSTTTEPPIEPWHARYEGADALAARRYRNARGDVVDLAVAVFGAQEDGREIVGYGQGAIDPESRWAWANDTTPPPHGHGFRISAPGMMREVVIFHVIAGRVTGSDNEVKLLTLRERLLGRPATATALIVSAEGEGARAAIDRFLATLGPIDQAVAAIARPDSLS